MRFQRTPFPPLEGLLESAPCFMIQVLGMRNERVTLGERESRDKRRDTRRDELISFAALKERTICRRDFAPD